MKGDTLQDALGRFSIAMFAWVIFRPDQAGALWKSDKGKEKPTDGPLSDVRQRNAVLFRAWIVFRSLLPEDLLGDEEGLQLWLEFGTQVSPFVTFCLTRPRSSLHTSVPQLFPHLTPTSHCLHQSRFFSSSATQI